MAHFRSLAVSSYLQHLVDHGFLQICLPQHSYDPRVDMLLNRVPMAVNPVLQSPFARMQHMGDCMDGINDQLVWLAYRMEDLAYRRPGE